MEVGTDGPYPVPAPAEPNETDREQIRVAAEKNRKFNETTLVTKANDRADEMAQDIERAIDRTIGRIIPPPHLVQAEIRFLAGSVELAATVVIWIGGIIAPALRDELGKMVQTIVSRVINGAVRTMGVPVAGPMKVTADRPTSAEVRLPGRDAVPASPSPPAPHEPTNWRSALPLANTVLLLLILLLLVLIVLPDPRQLTTTGTAAPGAPATATVGTRGP
jgi:hypothetical protein